MAFTNITNADIQDKGVKGLPDTPDMEASELKNQFDSLGDFAIDRIKLLISELEAETASISVGATVPEGVTASRNIQSILDGLNTIVQQNAINRHNHTNLEVLDTISQDTKDGYDQTVLKFQDITSVGTSVFDSNSEIPTSGAVVEYVNARIAEALGS